MTPYSTWRSRRIRPLADDRGQVLSDHKRLRCESPRRLCPPLLPAGAIRPEDRLGVARRAPGSPARGLSRCCVRVSARGRALPSPSGCSLRAARGRARRDSRRRPVRAAAGQTRSTTDRRCARPHLPPATTPSCRRTRRRVPNAVPSSSRAPVGRRGRRGIAADHARWALEHGHAANAEHADGGCRQPAGDSSPYRARRIRPTARRPLHR
jgi:hypothetical protein